VVTAANAELTLYKQVPPIKLKRDDRTFNCPLILWKYNEQKYKMFSISAQLLSIPATSVPSACIFSIVSKDRERLQMLLMSWFSYLIPCLESKDIMKHKTFKMCCGRGFFAGHWQLSASLTRTAAPGLIINDPFSLCYL